MNEEKNWVYKKVNIGGWSKSGNQVHLDKAKEKYTKAGWEFVEFVTTTFSRYALFRKVKQPTTVAENIGALVFIFAILAYFLIYPPKKSQVNDAQDTSSVVVQTKKEFKTPYTTNANYTACRSEQWLEDVVDFVVQGDKGSFNVYLTSQKCVVIKEGLKVTITDWPILKSTVGFIYNGVKFWSSRDAVNYP